MINKKAKNCGRKRVEIDTALMEAIPLGERTTMCDLSASMHMKSTTVFKRLKEKKIRRHSNALKPDLTHENMKERVRYCLSQLVPESCPENPVFKAGYDQVHIDEKWFYRTKKSQNFTWAPQNQIRGEA